MPQDTANLEQARASLGKLAFSTFFSCSFLVSKGARDDAGMAYY
jgi:hypothetical protein